MVYAPTFKGRLPDEVPEVIGTAAPPFIATVTVAAGSLVVGVTVMDVVAMGTLTV
jgi:hypothetical protein